MATRIIKEEEGQITVQFDNGDLRALKEIVAKWKFQDMSSALRFALAVLAETAPDKLCMKDDRVGVIPIEPGAQLLKKET